MGKHKPKEDPAKTLPAREFFGKYFEGIIAPDDEKPEMMNLACAMEREDYEAGSFRFDGWGPKQKREIHKAVRLLQEAGRQNDLEGFRRLVYQLLALLHVEIPDGAIELHFPRGAQGKADNRQIIELWHGKKATKKPKAQIYVEIAAEVYGDLYKHGNQRRRAQDNARVKSTIWRYEHPVRKSR